MDFYGLEILDNGKVSFKDLHNDLSDIYSRMAHSFEEADRPYRQYAEELRRTSETYLPESVNGN